MGKLDTKTIIWAIVAIIGIIALGFGVKALADRPVVVKDPDITPGGGGGGGEGGNVAISIIGLIGTVIGALGASGLLDGNKGNYGETGGQIGPATKPKWWEQLFN
jgi:hypothetical protein